LISVTNLQAVDVLKTEPNLESAKVTQIIDFSEAQQVRILCILITLDAVVSYRSVPRILQLLNLKTPLKLDWIPLFTSVINWSLRVGLGLLKQVKPIAKPWVAIIDHSIDIGTKSVKGYRRCLIGTWQCASTKRLRMHRLNRV
jgi:hypothetical protein